MSSDRPTNVFEWLDQIRLRPSMFLGESTPLQDLETLVGGYYQALHVHGIVEPVPALTDHFRAWIRLRTSWSMACGWATAIDEHVESERGLATFFELVDAYRKLVPVVLATTNLDDRHEPRGKRAVIGFGGRIARPDRVDVVQYAPSPIHFLRFHYGTRIEDQPTLLTSNGSGTTSIDDALAWVRDELGVEADEWTYHPKP